jgi:hypothetical protein
MGFRFRRSVKLLPGIRLNFGKRGISTSIGVRGAHVTFGPSGTRTTVGLPGSGLSYTHLEKSRHQLSVQTASETSTDSAGPPGSARRGFLWIGLIAVFLAIAVGRLTTHAPPLLVPTQTVADTATQAAAQAAENARAAEVKSAASGIAQISRTIANASTLKVSRVTVIPNGAFCYEFHMQNSRGVAYARAAVIYGGVLKPSGSIGFTELWNQACAHTGGRDITSEVETAVRSGNQR